jgi:hypothetical protein
MEALELLAATELHPDVEMLQRQRLGDAGDKFYLCIYLLFQYVKLRIT